MTNPATPDQPARRFDFSLPSEHALRTGVSPGLLRSLENFDTALRLLHMVKSAAAPSPALTGADPVMPKTQAEQQADLAVLHYAVEHVQACGTTLLRTVREILAR